MTTINSIVERDLFLGDVVGFGVGLDVGTDVKV